MRFVTRRGKFFKIEDGVRTEITQEEYMLGKAEEIKEQLTEKIDDIMDSALDFLDGE